MNRFILLTLSLSASLVLPGCAGTSGSFGCDATTSDSCMTIEQANEKAKRLEEGSAVKPDAAALPRLAEGSFRTPSQQPAPALTGSPSAHGTRPGPEPVRLISSPSVTPQRVVPPALPAPVPAGISLTDPRPLRVGERTAGLWIAPWIDTQDVYHQASRVFFVVSPSAWGKPRVN